MMLAEFLRQEEDRIGLMALAGKIGIAHTSLRKLTNGDYKRDMETYQRIAEAYSLSLWRVLEMAGYDLGLPNNSIAEQRIARMLSDILTGTELARLERATPDEIIGMMGWLEGLDIIRQRHGRAQSLRMDGISPKLHDTELTDEIAAIISNLDKDKRRIALSYLRGYLASSRNRE